MTHTKQRRRRLDLTGMIYFGSLLVGSGALVCLAVFTHAPAVVKTVIATIALAFAELARQQLDDRPRRRR